MPPDDDRSHETSAAHDAAALAGARRHAAEQQIAAERLLAQLEEVMRELASARRRQFCLQSPAACLRDRLTSLVARRPGRRARA